MRYRIPLLVFWILILFRLTAAQNPSESPEKPLYNPTGNEATVTGTINVTGTIPMSKRLDMSADPVCEQVNLKPQTEEVIVRDGKLENAFVYLKGESLAGYRFAMPDSDAVLVQRRCF